MQLNLKEENRKTLYPGLFMTDNDGGLSRPAKAHPTKSVGPESHCGGHSRLQDIETNREYRLVRAQ